MAAEPAAGRSAVSRRGAIAEPGTRLADAGGIAIAWDEFGDPADETLLLVMGLGMQMIAWDPELCELLAGHGFHVVRFDNRDVGLSSKIGGHRVNLLAGAAGATGSAAYQLTDMAADTAGLLDEIGAERAHLVGASMGGMISQVLAAERPERVASLCSIMAGTGRRRFATLPRLSVLRLLFREQPADREAFIDRTLTMFEAIGSPAYPVDRERLHEQAARSYDRCYYPSGVSRQLMAILASGNRSEQLRSISAPTQVIHGVDDPLVPAAAGREVAELIDAARLELVEGMGHDLPRELWPRFAELIAANARRASS
jgi:pimeloyl-ACP methyl ester carboxylesterase